MGQAPGARHRHARVPNGHTGRTAYSSRLGGPILPPCAVTVLVGALPAARVTDMCLCVGPPDVIALGSFTVLIMNLPAARIGDMTAHGGSIVMGMPTVLTG